MVFVCVHVMVFYLCAKVIIIVASQQLHPNVVFASVLIVYRVASVFGYSIRRELHLLVLCIYSQRHSTFGGNIRLCKSSVFLPDRLNLWVYTGTQVS